jgi:hypothetical protein
MGSPFLLAMSALNLTITENCVQAISGDFGVQR